jgi:hypothetical protein
MFGTSNLTGLEAVAEVDRLTGRKPGKLSEVQTQLALLLREGYRFVELDPFELARLKAEGLSYFKQIVGYKWTPEDTEYWTPERLEFYIRKCDAYKRRSDRIIKPYKSQITEVKSTPRLRDIKQLIRGGYVPLPLIENGSVNTSHAVMLYAQDHNGFLAYVPGKGNTLVYFGHRQFAKVWIQDSLTAVKHNCVDDSFSVRVPSKGAAK